LTLDFHVIGLSGRSPPSSHMKIIQNFDTFLAVLSLALAIELQWTFKFVMSLWVHEDGCHVQRNRFLLSGLRTLKSWSIISLWLWLRWRFTITMTLIIIRLDQCLEWA